MGLGGGGSGVGGGGWRVGNGGGTLILPDRHSSLGPGSTWKIKEILLIRVSFQRDERWRPLVWTDHGDRPIHR